MRVVLRGHVEGLGRKGDICDVADGYARNYLVPRGLALRWSPGVGEQAAAMRFSANKRRAADRADAQAIADRLAAKAVTVSARATETGQLYGSVSAAALVEAVQAQFGAVVDVKAVQIESPIRSIGVHTVPLHLHEEVTGALTVEVHALA